MFSFSVPPDPDFSDDPITVTITAASTTFVIPTFFTVNDDDIDEDEQSFAVVAEILGVPESISCFQTAPGTIPCYGRRGATEIRIVDNNSKFIALMIVMVLESILLSIFFLLLPQPW